MAKSYYIDRMSVSGLWGRKDFNLSFYRDVNIIIGPNASGKTTLLNILRFVLRPDIRSLSEIDFEEIEIVLCDRESDSVRTINVKSKEKGLSYKISRKVFQIDILNPSRLRMPPMRYRRHIEEVTAELEATLRDLIRAVWLPVNRRLPIPEDEEDEYMSYGKARRFMQLESVDHRLRQLLSELSKYRLQLDAQLSDLYKAFERQVLGITLYDKRHDERESMKLGALPTKEDRDALERAFKAADLWDSSMQRRIDDHFRMTTQVFDALKQKKEPRGMTHFLILPLIPRTQRMIDAARKLEIQRDDLFAPLKKYEHIVSAFLEDKKITIDDVGDLTISREEKNNSESLSPERLSSGEKQIMILLTQALVEQDNPATYVADEPELSLHVTWQERLLQSLIELAPELQIIVATHSPDIVGPFQKNLINLARSGGGT